MCFHEDLCQRNDTPCGRQRGVFMVQDEEHPRVRGGRSQATSGCCDGVGGRWTHAAWGRSHVLIPVLFRRYLILTAAIILMVLN